MLKFQNTTRAVFSPGGDSDYFDGLSLTRNPPELTAAYSQRNAWWLAELSRVIYRLSAVEGMVVRPDRRTVLKNAGLTEVLFISRNETQVSVISGGAFHAVAFRGTESLQDWLKDANVVPRPWEGPGLVHSGFQAALNDVWKELNAVLQTLRTPVFYTGHSLGAAIAVLAAARVDAAHRPLAVYTFGGPRCGDDTFRDAHPLRRAIYRVVNNRDVVPRVPPGYEHVGELLYITSDKRLLRQPAGSTVITDQVKDDDTHSLLKDRVPEQITDHAPVNYVAWMQRFADANWVRRFGG